MSATCLTILAALLTLVCIRRTCLHRRRTFTYQSGSVSHPPVPALGHMHADLMCICFYLCADKYSDTRVRVCVFACMCVHVRPLSWQALPAWGQLPSAYSRGCGPQPFCGCLPRGCSFGELLIPSSILANPRASVGRLKDSGCFPVPCGGEYICSPQTLGYNTFYSCFCYPRAVLGLQPHPLLLGKGNKLLFLASLQTCLNFLSFCGA